MADLHDPGRQRHGRRSLHPLDVLGVAGAALVVDGVTGAHIGADHEEIHRILCKGLCVEGVQLFRHGVVAELLAVQVAGMQQVAEAGIALILTVFGVVADGAADLVRLIIAAEHRTGRHTNGTVQHDAVLHQHIQNTRSEHAAHGAAFQHKSCFHNSSPSPVGRGTDPAGTSIIIFSILDFAESTRAEKCKIVRRPPQVSALLNRGPHFG